MQKRNVESLTVLLPPPKMQEKVVKLGKEPYKYALLNGQKFIALPSLREEKKFCTLLINFGVTSLQIPSSPDFLSIREANDVEISLAEIKAGKAKKFKSVDAFLKELKE
jgi:hypothetical protein